MCFFFFPQILVWIHTGLRNAEVMTCITFLFRFKIEIYLPRTSQEKKTYTTLVLHTHTSWNPSLVEVGSGLGEGSSPTALLQHRHLGQAALDMSWYFGTYIISVPCAPPICDTQFSLECSSSAIMDQLSKPTVRFLGEKASLRTVWLQLILI